MRDLDPHLMWFLWLTRLHTPNSFSIDSAVFPQLTADSPYTLQWAAHSPSKLPLPIRGYGSPSNTWFLGPIQVRNPNGISICSAVFAQLTAECPCTLQWAAPYPSKLPLLVGDLDHGFLGPPKSSSQTASRSVRPFLQSSLVWQTDQLTERQIDRPRYSVSNNRPHLCNYVVLRCGLIILLVF